MGDISCYCEPSEGEACEVWSETWHRARKEHVCCECRERINVGERYQKIFAIGDGDVYTYKTCEFCAKEFDRLAADYACLAKEQLACALVNELRNAS